MIGWTFVNRAAASRVATLATVLAGLALVVPVAEARTVYVTSNSGGCGGGSGSTVSAIDSATGAVKAITGLSAPASIVVAPDGKRAYIANQNPTGIAVLDTNSDSIIATIPTSGNPCHLSISPDGTRLYMPGTPPGKVGIVDTATNTVLAPLTVGPEVHSIASLPDGSKFYVGRGSTNSIITVFNAGQSFVKDIDIGANRNPYDMTITPSGLRLYATNTNSGGQSLSAIDTATDTESPGSPMATIGYPETVTSSIDGQRMYAGGTAGGFPQLMGIDVATNTEITTGGLPLTVPGGFWDLAVTPDGSSVFGVGANATLYKVSTATNTVVGTPVALPSATSSLAIVPDQPPIAALEVTPAAPGGATKFDSGGSTDPDGSIARYDWDFGDGTTAPNGGPTTSHVYKTPGAYAAKLTLTDNEGGSTARVFTGQAMLSNGGPSAAVTKTADTLPVISALSVRNKSFAVASRKKAKVKRGTAFRYTLDDKATVKFSIERKLKGRKSGKKCKAQTHKNRSKKKCTLYKSAGSLSTAGKAGKNSTRFSGKVKNKKLKRGAYRAIAVATDSAKGKSAAKTVSFKIRR